MASIDDELQTRLDACRDQESGELNLSGVWLSIDAARRVAAALPSW